MSRKKVTSSDVAKRAGVSQATVSMVLNKKYNVSFSKEVIQNVEQAAAELGYVLPLKIRPARIRLLFLLNNVSFYIHLYLFGLIM